MFMYLRQWWKGFLYILTGILQSLWNFIYSGRPGSLVLSLLLKASLKVPGVSILKGHLWFSYHGHQRHGLKPAIITYDNIEAVHQSLHPTTRKNLKTVICTTSKNTRRLHRSKKNKNSPRQDPKLNPSHQYENVIKFILKMLEIKF